MPGFCLLKKPSVQAFIIDPNLAVSKEPVEQLFRSRRSIRSYRETELDPSVIEEFIHMARWAPSARNVQPVSWIVVNNGSRVHELASMVIDWIRISGRLPELVKAFESGKDMIHRDAPCLLIAHAPESGFRPAKDCSIAVTSIEAAAPAFGLGACWAGFFMGTAEQHKPIISYLDLPEGHKVYAALMLGKPKVKYLRIPPRAEARIDWRR